MNDSTENKIESLINEVLDQAKDIRYNNFTELIYTCDLINKYLDNELRKHNLNRTKINILNNLVTHGGKMSPTELGKRVNRTNHSITNAMDILEEEGLIRRDGESQDRRLNMVILTEKGINLVKDTMPIRAEIASKAMSCFDQATSIIFTKNIKILRNHVINLIKNSNVEN